MITSEAQKRLGLTRGTCNKPQTVSAAPNSNTAEIAVAKNSVIMTSRLMTAFLNKKIQNIRGAITPECLCDRCPESNNRSDILYMSRRSRARGNMDFQIFQ